MNTNRFDIDSIVFDEHGLVVAITTDALTGEVLMQAYMDRTALEKTLETGRVHYFSRSRKKLWLKGETSGNFQEVVSIASDCDNDSVLLRVIQTGAACHTGSRSCFFNNYEERKHIPQLSIIKSEIDAVKDRIEHPEEGSYTNYLFNKGVEKICKKVGEEASECIIAAMKGNNDELSGEIADLIYHLIVLAQNQDLPLESILSVIEQRRLSERKRNY